MFTNPACALPSLVGGDFSCRAHALLQPPPPQPGTHIAGASWVEADPELGEGVFLPPRPRSVLAKVAAFLIPSEGFLSVICLPERMKLACWGGAVAPEGPHLYIPPPSPIKPSKSPARPLAPLTLSLPQWCKWRARDPATVPAPNPIPHPLPSPIKPLSANCGSHSLSTRRPSDFHLQKPLCSGGHGKGWCGNPGGHRASQLPGTPQFPRCQDPQPTQSLGKQREPVRHLTPLTTMKHQTAAFLTRFNTKSKLGLLNS